MYRQFDLREIGQTRWKNGGGLTQEIVSWPLHSGVHDFQWRVSVASITASGPFSTFPDVDRIILLLGGDGIRLRAPEQALDQSLDQLYRPLHFAGDWRTECELLGSASRDFNVMTRRDSVAADVQILRERTTAPASDSGLVFAASGTWILRTHSDIRLQPETGICWAGEPLQWTASPAEDTAAVLIAVRIFGRTQQ
ncbi:HutD family protein [Povalibacter sp.]|uniref:HutD/Ves family protein n=1 Tax=Povalibacter sp. TaxID=1962978 RepID=UPI002F42D87E